MSAGTYIGAPKPGANEDHDGIPANKWRRLLALGCAVTVLLAAGAVILATSPFSGPNNIDPGVSDNAFAISYQNVLEEPLSSQTEVQGTLTYAGGNNSVSSIVVVLPSGTASSAVTQSRQQVSSAAEILAADRLALASTTQAGTASLAQAEQAVATAQAPMGFDEQALGIGGRTGSETASQASLEVASAGQALDEDKAALSIVNQSNSELLTQATAQVAAARSALVADRAASESVTQANSEALAQAQHQLAAAQSTLATSEATLNNSTQANSEALAQAQQEVATAQATLLSDRGALTTARQSNSDSLEQAESEAATAQSALSGDESALAIDKATLSADEQKQAADCRVGTTPASGRGAGPTSPTSVPGACATDTSQVATDQSTVTNEDQKVATDRLALGSAQQNVTSTRTHNTQLSQQAQSQVVAAQTALTTAQQDVTSTRTHNTQAEQQALAKVASDEVGAASAEDGAASTRSNNALSAEQSRAKVTSDQAALSAAEENVASTNIHDRQLTQEAQAAVEGAELALSQARANLATAAATASIEDESSTYTALPQIGQVLRRGDPLFAIGGRSVILLYGPRQPWRAFIPGMSPGPDVAELNSNLSALGYGGPPGRDFSTATAAAVKKFQTAHGLAPTGQLPLGSVLFEPATFRVTTVTPTVGSSVTAGQAVLNGTLMARQVQIALDTSEQSHIAVGDKVSIVMPNNSTTPGVVSYVGTVAQLPSNNNGPSAPTVNVYVSPLDPSATGNLDQLPVNVWITTASVQSALVVPVDALLALARGGYALEVVGSDGSHHLVAVTLGLFDDADGLVQVSGPGVQVGERVVVPGT